MKSRTLFVAFLAAVLFFVSAVIYSRVTEPTVTVTSDQFGRLVSIDYEEVDRIGLQIPAKRYTQETEDGCDHLAVLQELGRDGWKWFGRLEEVTVERPESPDRCDQLALQRLIATMVDAGQLEAVFSAIGEDEDSGSLDL